MVGRRKGSLLFFVFICVVVASLPEQEQQVQVKKAVVTLVVYDKIRGYLNWLQDWFRDAASTKCSTKCVLSEDRSLLASADMVIFHAPTHGQMNPALPNNRPPHALYMLLSMEQPKYARYLSDTKYLEQNFDLLATYSLSEMYPGTKVRNMPITYYPLNILSPNAVMQPARPFADKTGYGTNVAVALFTSNCHAAGASGRGERCLQ